MARLLQHTGGDSLTALQDHLENRSARRRFFVVSASRQGGAQIKSPVPKSFRGIGGGKSKDLAQAGFAHAIGNLRLIGSTQSSEGLFESGVSSNDFLL
jgi:hypothetical protein